MGGWQEAERASEATEKGRILEAGVSALAATVGTGNVAGVAGAIAIGGPGAIFWMWISALHCAGNPDRAHSARRN